MSRLYSHQSRPWSRRRLFARFVGAWLGVGVLGACAEGPHSSTPSDLPPDRAAEGTVAPPAATAATAAPSTATSRPGAPLPSAPPPAPPDLYDPDVIPKFELGLDADAMATLSTATAENKETWVHGRFKFGTIAFDDVGVRLKGSHTFRTLPLKASLKVKFNKWVKGQKVHGLHGLTLNNMVADRNNIRQRIAYHVFRSLGLPAPKANTAELTINGESYGIYANIETPDMRFLRRVFGAKAKTLYEAHTPGTWLPGSASRWEIDEPDPAAPIGTKPDLDLLFQAVFVAKDETLLDDLKDRLHTKQWLRFCAAEAVTGAYDGYAFGFWGSHNYFMAGDTDGKFSIIPWSTDGSLNDDNGVPDASKPLSDVLLTRCARSASCWNEYLVEVRSVLAEFEALGLVDLAHKWHDQIDALVRADPKRESTIESYTRDTERLYLWLVARPSVMRAQLGL